jgi:CO/xanthine dehydrogenase Mo-binding subunit
MAAKAGIDPMTFRLRQVTDQRLLRLLETAARAFGYVPAPAPSGGGVGLACGAWRGTLVAALAQVAVDKSTGKIQVERVLEAVDVVLVDNPDLPSQGLGEPPVVPVGPVLANAVFDAVGARVCHLPMTPERVLEALKGN